MVIICQDGTPTTSTWWNRTKADGRTVVLEHDGEDGEVEVVVVARCRSNAEAGRVVGLIGERVMEGARRLDIGAWLRIPVKPTGTEGGAR
jgi:hypothetical protein